MSTVDRTPTISLHPQRTRLHMYVTQADLQRLERLVQRAASVQQTPDAPPPPPATMTRAERDNTLAARRQEWAARTADWLNTHPAGRQERDRIADAWHVGMPSMQPALDAAFAAWLRGVDLPPVPLGRPVFKAAATALQKPAAPVTYLLGDVIHDLLEAANVP